MKRLVVCCDGTWQELNSNYPTNVAKIAQAVKTVTTDINSVPQIVFYGAGIGTGDGLDKWFGGAFGWGIDKNIQDAYRFLCLNYDAGDEIYLFGFSRGAYTVRSLAGLIRCAGGLLPRSEIRKTPNVYDIYRSFGHYPDEKDLNEEQINTRELKRKEKAMEALSQNIREARLTLLGCWDTVGSLGVPDQIPFLPLDQWLNKKYKFHDYKLSKIIDKALHAVAIDEPRKVFDVAPMEQQEDNKNRGQILRQVWFPGDHGCVGGGTKDIRGLSDGTLDWMLKQIEELELGLELNRNAVECDLDAQDNEKKYGIYPDYTCPFDNTIQFPFNLTGRKLREIKDPFEALHESVIKRWCDPRLSYRPENMPQELVNTLNGMTLA